MKDRQDDLEWFGTQAAFHPEIAAEILETVKNGFSLRAAAGFAGIPYRIAGQWVDNHATFGYDLELALAQRVYRLESEILNTEDPVRGKVLMQALRRAAPEVWADPREVPPQDRQLPQLITLNVVEATPRSLPLALQRQNEDIPPNAPGSDRVN
jgi:hypothetical protein